MAIAMIPTSSLSFRNITVLMIYVPGILLMMVGFLTFLAGIHAAFRWTLLDTSIHCNDEHLREKFISAGTHQNNNNGLSNNVIQLDRYEFSVLVMTLGLDLDEITMIPKVFTQEIRTKNPNCITFTEFHSWWRGRRSSNSKKSSKKQGDNSNSSHKSPSGRVGRAISLLRLPSRPSSPLPLRPSSPPSSPDKKKQQQKQQSKTNKIYQRRLETAAAAMAASSITITTNNNPS